LRIPEDTIALAKQLHARATEREQQEIARLGQVLQFAQLSGCQVNALCRHFGETRAESCGHCTGCLDPNAPETSPHREWPPVDSAVIDQALALRMEHPELSDPVVLARLLCGITSPALSRAKLTSHPLFAACAQQRFAELRERFERA